MAWTVMRFPRRATAYKRPNLVFHDLEALRALASRHGGLQIVANAYFA